MEVNINIFFTSTETPLKPKREDWSYRCPRCNGFIGLIGFPKIERCEHCSQKFDWKNVV